MPSRERVAVVTGGSSGIGRATGRALVKAGYDTVLTARGADRLQVAAREAGARWVAADAADPEQFRRVVAEAGRVDLLVHAAGMMAGTFVRKETVSDFTAILRANLVSSFVVANTSLPVMPAGGRMIFLSSSSAHAPQRGRAAYTASKAGLNGFASALAAEVARDGISVHLVTTGPVATPMLDDVRFPMRALHVDEVVRVILWLDTVDPSATVPEVRISAVESGPYAPEPLVPRAARELGRTDVGELETR